MPGVRERPTDRIDCSIWDYHTKAKVGHIEKVQQGVTHWTTCNFDGRARVLAGIRQNSRGFEKCSQNGGRAAYFKLFLISCLWWIPELNNVYLDEIQYKQMIKNSFLKNESNYVILHNQALPKFYAHERSGVTVGKCIHMEFFFRVYPPFLPPFSSLSLPFLLPFLVHFILRVERKTMVTQTYF